jgi:hypothetical protein
MSKAKQITIEVDCNAITYTLQGDKAEKLETVLGAFEDVLAQNFDIDPMVNSLDIVDAVAL